MSSPFTVPRPKQRPGTQVGADSRVESRFESEAAPTPQPPEEAKQGSSQPGVAHPKLDGPTLERGSRSSGASTAEITPAADGRDERAGHPLRSWSVASPRSDRTVCAYCGHFHRKTLAGYLPWSKKRRPAKCVCCKEDYDAVFPKGPPDDEDGDE